MSVLRHALVYTRESQLGSLLAAALPDALLVTSRREFVTALAMHRSRVAFVDADLLSSIDSDAVGVSVIAIVDGALDAIVNVLTRNSSLRHVVTTSMLAGTSVQMNLEQIGHRIEEEPEHTALGSGGKGRVALLTSSNRREARLDRLREFFESHGTPSRTVFALGEIAEELVMNALYDAPAEAGYFRQPVSRMTAVELPPEHACEISYGLDEGAAFVRLRDPFGSLTRTRLLSVLERCSRSGLSLDESRGGAGLGLWRVFSHASSVTLTVIPGRLTDVLVWVETNRPRKAPKHAHTIQVFFPQTHVVDDALGRFAADHDSDLIDESFTALIS